MKLVRHLPVAEQYPSRTAMVSVLASKRISGIFCRPASADYWAICRPEILPINVRPHLLAANHSIGQLLDFDAAICWHPFFPISPLADHDGLNIKTGRNNFAGAAAQRKIFIKFHSGNVANGAIFVKPLALLIFFRQAV